MVFAQQPEIIVNNIEKALTPSKVISEIKLIKSKKGMFLNFAMTDSLKCLALFKRSWLLSCDSDSILFQVTIGF